MFKCIFFKCKDTEVLFSCYNELISHFKSCHKELKATSAIECPIPICNRRPFLNRNSLKRHFLIEHKKYVQCDNDPMHGYVVDKTGISEKTGEGNVSHENPNLMKMTNVPINSATDENGTIDKTPDPGLDVMLEDKLFSFCSLMHSHSAVPSSIVLSTMTYVHDLLQEVNDIYGKMFKSLSQGEEGNSSNSLPKMEEMLRSAGTMFQGLTSNYRQLQYFERKRLYVPPQPKVLGKTFKVRKLSNRILRLPVNETNVFIPMRKILALYLSQPTVLNEIKQYMDKLKSETVTISNFIQGEVWRKLPSHPDGITLPLQLYNDEFECGNPLGSHAGKNKINGTYFSIASILPEKSGSVDHIFVTMLTKSSDLKRFGNKRIFRILVKELNFLSKKGITVQNNDFEPEKIYFDLGLLLGDNLGLNGILGYVENFSKSLYCCRICRADKVTREGMVVEDITLLRTIVNYNQDVKKKCPTQTGIKEPCIFNNVNNFHVAVNHSCDVLHDLYHGVVKYDLIFILNHYIKVMGLFTLDEINAEISVFNFGFDNHNKPPLLTENIFKKSSYNVSASECSILIKYFGLLIGHRVPLNDPVWELYLALRKILDIVGSRVLRKDIQPLLSHAIEEHHNLYMELTKKKLPFKFHILVHYPRFIREIGPVRQLSSDKYERNHQDCKSTAKTIYCRKNLCLSIAKKVQLKLSYMLHSQKFSKKVLSFGPAEPSCKKDKFLRELSRSCTTTQIPDILNNPKTLSVSWVKLNGTRYCKGVAINGDIHHDTSFPLFGELEKIFITSSQEVFFCLKNFQTVNFNAHFHAFELRPHSSFSIIKTTDLHDFHVHNVVVRHSSHFVTSLNYF